MKRTRRGMFTACLSFAMSSNVGTERTLQHLAAVTAVSRLVWSRHEELPRSTSDVLVALCVSRSKMLSTKRCTKRKTTTCRCNTAGSPRTSRQARRISIAGYQPILPITSPCGVLLTRPLPTHTLSNTPMLPNSLTTSKACIRRLS